MTTAHRPTWAPAVGGEEQGGMRIYGASRLTSAKNLPSHTKLKFRQDGQADGADVRERDLRAELEEKERKHFKSKTRDFEEERQQDLKLLESAGEGAGEGAKPRMLVPKAVDADDEDADDVDSDDSDDDEDDEAELLAELERIKKERAEEAARKAAEEAAKQDQQERSELARGNPLLQERLRLQEAAGDFTMKRRWDDDVVFKNQTRGEPKAQKRFINDTIRNDFHRRFLERYIK